MSKVVFLINSFTAGGAEKVMTVLINNFHQEKIDMEIICLEKNFFYSLPDDIKVTYLSNFDGSESSVKKLLYIPIFALRLQKYLKNNNIRLVQSHLYRANYINILSYLMGGGQFTQIVNHGIISRYKLKGLNGKINLFLIKYLYARADLLITISKAMQIDMQNLFDFKNKQIVINNPYDINSINRLMWKKITDFSFNTNKRYLINVGRLIPLKRNKDILTVLKKLPEHIELIFLGDGEEKENLFLLAEELKIRHRVHFLGNVENPYKYVRMCDMCINCSESEGFPNVLVESMICRTPIISSDCISGPREILAPDTDIGFQLTKGIEKAKFGILYPVGDLNSLAKAIIELLNDVELKEKYKVEAYQRAYDFSVEKIANQYKKVLNV